MQVTRGAVSVTAVLCVFTALVVNFQSLEILSRELIAYDDERYILPIKGLSVAEYFNQWLADPENYSYPLRELTFAFDFIAKDLTTISTYWVSNFVYWALTMWVVYRLLEVLLGSAYFMRAAAFAFISLHPLNVTMVQWASMRKHLLVALFLALPTLRTAKLVAAKRDPRWGDWAFFLIFYAFSMLCYPSGLFWILWPFWMFRRSLFRRAVWPRTAAIGAAALAVSLACYFPLLYRSRLDKFDVIGNLFGSNPRGWWLALNSAGRGFFDLVVPLRIVEYYEIRNPLNWIGFAMLLVFIAALIYVRKKATVLPPDGRAKAEVFSWAALGLILLVPVGKVYIAVVEFVWSIRYLYLPLPYLVSAGALLARDFLRSRQRTSSKRWPSFLGLVAVAGVAASFVVISWRTVPLWQNDFILMKHCAETERSTKCINSVVEKLFDRQGCVGLLAFFQPAQARYQEFLGPEDFIFKAELPFYESFCFATEVTQSLAQKEEHQTVLAAKYQQAPGTAFASVILALQAKNKDLAWQRARDQYLDHRIALVNATEKLVDMFRGQAQALCELMEEGGAEQQECVKALSLFAYKFHLNKMKLEAVKWAYDVTIQAYGAADQNR